MSTVAPASPMTVEEFEKLPEPLGGRYELRHGAPVLVTWPQKVHANVQKRLFIKLLPLLPESEVQIELAFRPSPEHEVWSADIGVVGIDRWNATDNYGWLSGAPDMVIEVVNSPVTSDEVDDREQTAFAGGCKEFWVVFVRRRQIRVTTAEGTIHRYGKGEQIPVGNGHIAVDDVFSVVV
jgi:Uma2 family endonuclease